MGCVGAAKTATLSQCHQTCGCKNGLRPRCQRNACSGGNCVGRCASKCREACDHAFLNVKPKVRVHHDVMCSNGEWASAPLECEPVKTCPPLSSDGNAVVALKAPVLSGGGQEGKLLRTPVSQLGKECAGTPFFTKHSLGITGCRKECAKQNEDCDAMQYVHSDPQSKYSAKKNQEASHSTSPLCDDTRFISHFLRVGSHWLQRRCVLDPRKTSTKLKLWSITGTRCG